jgi:hypothetical protein
MCRRTSAHTSLFKNLMQTVCAELDSALGLSAEPTSAHRVNIKILNKLVCAEILSVLRLSAEPSSALDFDVSYVPKFYVPTSALITCIGTTFPDCTLQGPSKVTRYE